MVGIFEIANLAGRYTDLITWGNAKIPEAEQMISEARALLEKHQSTIDAMVPLMPKLNTLTKDVQNFLKQHDASIKELVARTPEIQQLVSEAMALTQPRYRSPFDEMPNPGEG